MTPARSVAHFEIAIPRGFAYRLLGLHRSNRPPRASVIEVFEEELAVAHGLVDARAVTRVSDAGLPGSQHVDPAVPLAAVVCTIGPALEERVAKLSDDGQATRAMVLDAIGSSAAEEVADRSNQILCGRAADAERSVGRRRSPGYGRWDVSEQRALLAFVEPDDIGVSLSERCMMVPRKSVSYVAQLLAAGTPDASRRDEDERRGDRCSRCNMTDCPYRESVRSERQPAPAAAHREAR